MTSLCKEGPRRTRREVAVTRPYRIAPSVSGSASQPDRLPRMLSVA